MGPLSAAMLAAAILAGGARRQEQATQLPTAQNPQAWIIHISKR